MLKLFIIFITSIVVAIAETYPFDLSISNPIKPSGSDQQSLDFNKNDLPSIKALIAQSSKEYIPLNPSKFKWDDLVLSSNSNVRVYYISEGAAYRNTLGYSTTNGTPLDKSSELIFPDVSENNLSIRTSDGPLKAGDFVDLGAFKAGTNLDFFLIANGYSGGRDFYSTEFAQNGDGLTHAVNLGINSIYTILSFEDMKGGGDRDYNDSIFAIFVTPMETPEPSLAIGGLLLMASLSFIRTRR